MAVITVSDAVYAWPSRILNFMCLLFAIGSIIHHCIKVKDHISSASAKSKKRITTASAHYSLYLSIALIVFVLLYNIFTLFIQFANITDVLACRIICFGAFNGYIAVKWALYMILSFRGSEAFGDSNFGISNEKLIVWRIFVTIANITTVIFGVMSWDVIINKNGNYYTCQLNTEFDTTPLTAIGVVDVTACGVNLLLFIVPLIRINKEMNRINLRLHMRDQSPPVEEDEEQQQEQQRPTSPSQERDHVAQTGTGRSNRSMSVPKVNGPLHKIAKKLTLLTVISVGTTVGATILIAIIAMPAVWYV